MTGRHENGELFKQDEFETAPRKLFWLDGVRSSFKKSSRKGIWLAQSDRKSLLLSSRSADVILHVSTSTVLFYDHVAQKTDCDSFFLHTLPTSYKNTKIMGQEFSTKPNEQRYAERYATKYSRYFYSLGFIGLLLSFGGYLFRYNIPDGSSVVIQFVVITSTLLLLLYLKGTSSPSSSVSFHHPSSSNPPSTRQTLPWCTHHWCDRYQCRSDQWLVCTHRRNVRGDVCLCESWW